MRHSRSWAAAAIVLTLLLAGCGGEGQETLQEVDDAASGLGAQLESEIGSAQEQLEQLQDLGAETRTQVEDALSSAESAAQDAREALEQAGGEAEAEAQERLEAARQTRSGRPPRTPCPSKSAARLTRWSSSWLTFGNASTRNSERRRGGPALRAVEATVDGPHHIRPTPREAV